MENKAASDFFAAARRILESASVMYGKSIPLSECNIISPHKLDAPGFVPRSVLMFAAPYFSRQAAGGEHCRRSVSLYAVPRDYHIFFSELFDELNEKLSLEFPNVRFMCFADNSPIGEVRAASKAGLGMIGDNGLLITKRYGSFVFLGELICELVSDSPAAAYPIEQCDGCGRCKAVCPCECVGTSSPDKRTRCLSSLTQAKSPPDSETIELMRGSGELPATVWGCDACQLVCPYNENPDETPIKWFKRDLILNPTASEISSMTDDEFYLRAFSWRGRSVIERNLKITEKN